MGNRGEDTCFGEMIATCEFGEPSNPNMPEGMIIGPDDGLASNFIEDTYLDDFEPLDDTVSSNRRVMLGTLTGILRPGVTISEVNSALSTNSVSMAYGVGDLAIAIRIPTQNSETDLFNLADTIMASGAFLSVVPEVEA